MCDKYPTYEKYRSIFDVSAPFDDLYQKYLDDSKHVDNSKNLKCGKFIYPLNTTIDGVEPSEFLKSCGLHPTIECVMDEKITLKIPDIPIELAEELWKYLNIHNNNEIEAAVLPLGTMFTYE